MKLHVTIDGSGAAFEDPGYNEWARILRRLATDIEYERINPIPLRDLNGNKVGEARWELDLKRDE